jgi:transcription antitermination factor NusG
MNDVPTAPAPRFGASAPCEASGQTGGLISSEILRQGGAHGGARPNSGGSRPNSGGPRPGAGRKPQPAGALLHVAPAGTVPRWYCLRTHPNQEKAVDTDLRLLGFEVFAPTIFKPAIPARRLRNGVIRPARPVGIEPLFPRYFFLRFRCALDPWQPIIRWPGVDRIISVSPERPAAVPDSAIAALRALCGPNDCIYPRNMELRDRRPAIVRPLPIKAGTELRILNGPFADLTGICHWSNGARVKLLLNIMGGAVTLRLDRSEIETVTPV